MSGSARPDRSLILEFDRAGRQWKSLEALVILRYLEHQVGERRRSFLLRMARVLGVIVRGDSHIRGSSVPRFARSIHISTGAG